MTPAIATNIPPQQVVSGPTPPATDTNPTREAQAQARQVQQGKLSIAYLNSTVLARRVAYSLYLPPCYEANSTHLYPVLYLLHGAKTDHTQWPDLNVAPDADSLIAQGMIGPLIVVMPDGDYGPGEDYGAFVLRDLERIAS